MMSSLGSDIDRLRTLVDAQPSLKSTGATRPRACGEGRRAMLSKSRAWPCSRGVPVRPRYTSWAGPSPLFRRRERSRLAVGASSGRTRSGSSVNRRGWPGARQRAMARSTSMSKWSLERDGRSTRARKGPGDPSVDIALDPSRPHPFAHDVDPDAFYRSPFTRPSSPPRQHHRDPRDSSCWWASREPGRRRSCSASR
jgi:hypothetical protein